jgi:predicted DNA-binding transcriptional regulator YafY
VKRRVIEPHRLVAGGRRWHLVAWDEVRDIWRGILLDRIERAVPTSVLFRERSLPDSDVTAYIARNVSQVG